MVIKKPTSVAVASASPGVIVRYEGPGGAIRSGSGDAHWRGYRGLIWGCRQSPASPAVLDDDVDRWEAVHVMRSETP